MSGKLIHSLKRKRDESTTADSVPTPSTSSIPTTVSNDNSLSSVGCKREKLNADDIKQEVPDEIQEDQPNGINRNTFLDDALRKISELQNELNTYDDYSDDSCSDDSDYSDMTINNRTLQGNEAEALGFAMCARETLLFLQAEGVPETSPIYRALKERLVGQCHDIPI